MSRLTAPARLRGDPQRLRQVLVNLLSNTIKFTEQSKVVLRAESGENDADKMKFTLSLEDTGVGIGLAISRNLIELMGDHLGLDSEPGRGSRFYLELVLPRADSTTPPAPDAAATSIARFNLDFSVGRVRVWVCRIVWQGATTRVVVPRKEEQRGQANRQTCNRTRSGLTQ